MNASKARKEGINAFCPEDTPEEYFQRVWRKPSLYYLECFTQGWNQAASEYEDSLKETEKEVCPCCGSEID